MGVEGVRPGASPRGRRPRREGDRTRARILAAATREFSAKGFHGARVDAIARRAKVNKERIYAYFGSKEGLFGETLRACFQEIAAEESDLLAIPTADCAAFPERLLRLYFAVHGRRPWLWRLLAWENLDGGRRSSSLEGLKKPLLAHLRGLYEAGLARGEFRPGVSFDTLLFILTAVSAFWHSNEKTLPKSIGLDTADPAAQERLVRETLALLRA